MSVTTFWTDVAECRRLMRHHRRIRDEVHPAPLWRILQEAGSKAKAARDEVRPPPPLWRFGRVLLPWALVPLLAVARWDWLGLSQWVGPGLLGLVLLISLGILGPLRLTTFEALRVPSRRALFVARVATSLPWGLWVGLWGTAGGLTVHAGAIRDWQQAALYLLVGAQIPWLVLALLGTIVIVSKLLPLVPTGFWIFLLVPLTLLLLASAPLDQLVQSHLLLMPPGMLLLEIGLLALQVWVLGRLEPMSQISGLVAPPPRPDLAHRAKAGATPRGRGVAGKLGPAPLLAGRHGLGWAAAYYAVRKLWKDGSLGFLGWLMTLYVFVIFYLSMAHDNDLIGNWLWLIAVPMFPQLSGSPLHVSNPQRLYLLGVDYRRQLVHRLRTFWVSPALLGTAVATPLAVAMWGDAETTLALLALMAGLTLYREGCFGWPSLHAILGEGYGCLSQFLIILTLALGTAYLVGAGRWAWLPGPGWDKATRLLILAACFGAVGLAGMLYKWWRFDEARLGLLVRA